MFRLTLVFRCYSTDIRVRFAPSPTGQLHLGGLRTALFNYFFARSKKGKFILRIEDTDRKRLVSGAIQALEDDLNWLGLSPDEGPNQGGDYGPYLQSERTNLYSAEANKLLATGSAYWCFCSEKRLDILRKHALRNHQIPKYDNHCRTLTPEEIENKLNSGIEKCIRFKLGPAEKFIDRVFGPFLYEVGGVEGDPVILKKDGFPTYHLANVVDDHHMRISHVIRGVEWLQSTPKHLMIYRALGYKPPEYGHLPLLLNPDGTKLSKRQGDITVESLRSKGVEPRALVNFISQSGSGFPHDFNSTSSSLQLLSDTFDLSLVNTHSGKLFVDRLDEFNRAELMRQVTSPQELSRLIDRVTHLVQQTFSHSGSQLVLEEEYVRNTLEWCLPRVTRLNQLVCQDFQFLWVRPEFDESIQGSHLLLEKVEQKLNQIEFSKKDLSDALKKLSSEENVEFKSLMKLLRSCLSGLKEGPGVAEMMEQLGKKTTFERLQQAVQYSKNSLTCKQ